MANTILIVGVGGLAKEMTDLATVLGFEVEAYFTEQTAAVLHPMQDVRIVSSLEAVASRSVLIAIGDTRARQRFFELLGGRFSLPTLIHPSACISPSVQLGQGVLVMQNVVVNAEARVADGALLNVGCCVAHDCTVGAFSHLAPSTQMGGGSSVGAGVFCGTSSVVLPNISVGDWSVCGAGSVVTKDVPERSLAIGVPAQVIKSL